MTITETFHNKHEVFTEVAYKTPGMLPDRYVFILTNLCNLKCAFCFLKRKPTKESMAPEDWINLAEQLPENARVTITGGEPLLFTGFNKVFSYVAERFDCNIITNGLLLADEKIDFLLSYSKLKVLSISIDGIDNEIRGIKSEEWKGIEKVIEYFIKRRKEINSDCILEAKTLVLDQNAEDLLKIHKYCVETFGCDHHTFQFLKGSPIQHADYMFEFDEIFKRSGASRYRNFGMIKEGLEMVREYNIREGKRAFLHPKIANLVSEDELTDIDFLNRRGHVKTDYLPCKFPWSSVHVNFDGVLFPCLAIPMGNVKKTPLSKIINGAEFNKFKAVIKERGTVEACNRCGWLRPAG